MLTSEAQVGVRNLAWSFLCPALFLSSPRGSLLSYPTWKLLPLWLTLMETHRILSVSLYKVSFCSTPVLLEPFPVLLRAVCVLC